MKKTLCKTIHESYYDAFMCLENIISIKIKKVREGGILSNNNYYLVIIYYDGGLDKYSFKYQNEDSAVKFKNAIIKELEEYYGLGSDQ